MSVTRRDALKAQAAMVASVPFGLWPHQELYPEPELLPAFTCKKGPERLLWASIHDEYGNTMSEYSDGTVDYHFCDGKKVLGAKKSDMDYYKKWWRDHG